MNLGIIPFLLLGLLLPDEAVMTEGPTYQPTSPPPTTTLPPLSTSSLPSTETQPPPLQSSSPPSPSSPQALPETPSSPLPTTTTTTTTTTAATTTTTETQPSSTESVLSWLTSSYIAHSTCPESDQIHCGTSSRCTRIRYICDGDNDCGDNTDESSALCAAWRNSDCERNLAQCTRLGRSDCVTISNYCTLTDPPCEGTLDRRLCVMLNNGKIGPLDSLELPTTTTTTTTTTEPTTHMPIHVMEEMWKDDFEEKLTHTIRHPDCPQLYTRVGNLCVSVFFIGNMTWLESRAFCRAIGGDLLTLAEDLSPFTTILQHFAVNGLTADFWVGGRYINETAGWMWVNDKPITLGSPFWGVRYNDVCSTRLVPYLNATQPANDGACYHYTQAPPMITSRHCVASTYQQYFYLTDEDCFGKKSPLCVLPLEKKKQAL